MEGQWRKVLSVLFATFLRLWYIGPMENIHTLDKTYQQAVRELQKKTGVAIMAQHESEVFINLFRQHFLNGTCWLHQNEGTVSRSNWTYHTACSMLLACRDMNFTTEFESSGRHDACIRNQFKEVILYGEWEWDCMDVFGKGKELHKLITSVENNQEANAFLLTYVDDSQYKGFLQNIFDVWTMETDAALFLMTPVLKRTEDTSSFISLRVVHLQRDAVICWAN